MNDEQMPEILITGGTGLLGKSVCALFDRDHIPYVIATHNRQHLNDNRIFIDLSTGEGIKQAVIGKKIILHLASDKKRPKNDISGTAALLREIQALEEKPHLIYISIVGIDRLPLPYFKEKWQTEQAIINAAVPYSILRATQFHEYVEDLLQQFLKWPLGILPKKVPIQPIDVSTVAKALYMMVKEPPSGMIKDLGGPQVFPFIDAANSWLKKNNKRRWLLNFPLWGVAGRNLNNGALTCKEKNDQSVTWNDWLNKAR